MEPGDLTGAVLDGRYKVLGPIAQGAMGVVYRAERLKLGKIVAIKVLHDELPNELSSRKRFEIEATAMAKLEHPNCAAVLDVGTHDGRPFVVMDFISGTDLKTLLEAGPMPIARASDVVKQVLSGVAHAHELGIIHRDIKPANIILSQKAGLGDHVKILDFGLARLQAEQTSKLTTGIVVGTPAYMSPEQIRGTTIDSRADLYACGVLLAELLTGKKPFHSDKDDPIEVVHMHLKSVPPRLDALLPGTDFGDLEAVVAKALAKVADDRYQTAAEFVVALEAAGKRLAGTASTQLAAPAVTDSQAQQISESMFIPEGQTNFALSTVTPAASVVAASAPVAPVASSPVSDASALVSPIPPPVVEPDPLAQLSGLPTTAPPPVRANPDGLPFTRRQLMIGGGGVLGLIVLIAIIAKAASGGDGTPAKVDEVAVGSGSGEIEMDPTPVEGPDKLLARAQELVANGENEAAISLLGRAAKKFPDDADLPYLAGKLYFAKLWWTDGLKQFRDAVRADPSLRTDPELIKIVLKGFITTPSYNDELADFLHDTIGTPAEQFLAETAADHPSAAIRARAKGELKRYQ